MAAPPTNGDEEARLRLAREPTQAFVAYLEKNTDLVNLLTTFKGYSTVSLDLDSISGFVDAYKYKGLDVQAIMAFMITKAKLANRVFPKDLLELLCAHLLRGNNIIKLMKSVEGNAANQLRVLVDLYNITEKGGAGNSRVTLARIALAFPLAAYKVASHSSMPPGGPWRKCPAAFPNAMRFPFFAAILIENEFQDVYKAYLRYSVAFSVYVSTKKNRRTKHFDETTLEEQTGYVRAACDNSMVSIKDRRKILKEILSKPEAAALISRMAQPPLYTEYEEPAPEAPSSA